MNATWYRGSGLPRASGRSHSSRAQRGRSSRDVSSERPRRRREGRPAIVPGCPKVSQLLPGFSPEPRPPAARGNASARGMPVCATKPGRTPPPPTPVPRPRALLRRPRAHLPPLPPPRALPGRASPCVPAPGPTRGARAGARRLPGSGERGRGGPGRAARGAHSQAGGARGGATRLSLLPGQVAGGVRRRRGAGPPAERSAAMWGTWVVPCLVSRRPLPAPGAAGWRRAGRGLRGFSRPAESESPSLPAPLPGDRCAGRGPGRERRGSSGAERRVRPPGGPRAVGVRGRGREGGAPSPSGTQPARSAAAPQRTLCPRSQI